MFDTALGYFTDGRFWKPERARTLYKQSLFFFEGLGEDGLARESRLEAEKLYHAIGGGSSGRGRVLSGEDYDGIVAFMSR